MLLFFMLVMLLYSEHFAFRISGIFQKKNTNVMYVCRHMGEQIFMICHLARQNLKNLIGIQSSAKLILIMLEALFLICVL